jgi:hypothetical protein
METTISVADLVHLGFAPEAEMRRSIAIMLPRQGSWYTKGHMRVVLHGEDGTEVFFFRTAPRDGLVEWSARFDGHVPARVVRAAIFSALEGG